MEKTQKIIDLMEVLPANQKSDMMELLLDVNEKYPHIEFEKISLNVAGANTQYDIAAGQKTDATHKRVVGLMLNTTDEAALIGSTIKFWLDNRRIFDGEEAKLLYSNYAVPPSKRFYPFINQAIDQTPIYGYYKSGAVFTGAYVVTFYLMCIPNK